MGLVFKVNEGVAGSIALSTTEAGGKKATEDTIWLNCLFGEISLLLNVPVLILLNKGGAIKLTRTQLSESCRLIIKVWSYCYPIQSSWLD